MGCCQTSSGNEHLQYNSSNFFVFFIKSDSKIIFLFGI